MVQSVIYTAGVLLFRDDKVLLIKHTEKAGSLAGTYGLPAGRIAKEESDKHAAMRELEQETGFKTTDRNLIEYPGNMYSNEITRKGASVSSISVKLFLCKNFFGQMHGSFEATPEWVDVDDIYKISIPPDIKQIIKHANAYIKYAQD